MHYLLSALLITLAAGRPVNDLSAAKFAVDLYAPYRNAKDTSTGYSSLDEIEEGDIYSTEVLHLLKADRARTPEGSEGALDADPLCQCQDSEGMRLIRVKQKSLTPSKADVSVTLRFAGSPREMKHFPLLLIRQSDGWRVDDIRPSKGQTLRQALQPSKQ
jgi:hypothetical protein